MDLLKSNKVPIKVPFYYGWIIVLIASLGVFFSGPGQTYSISIFIDPYIQDFGWTRSSISSAYSAATLAAGILLFFVGYLVDKYGHRIITTIIALLLGLACFWNSAIMSPVMLFIGFFLVRLLGQGSMILLSGTLVPQWFFSKRGRALSFLALGGFISSAVFPPINSWIIMNWGWAEAWKLWGVLLMLFFTPLAFYFIRNKPENVGLMPDNKSPEVGDNNNQKTSYHLEEINWTLKEAAKNKIFWFVIFCSAIPPLINTGITFHLVSILGERGIEPFMAAIVLSLMAAAGFPSSIAAGFILEKVRANIVLSFFFFVQIFIIIFLAALNTTSAAVIFGVIWGITVGFERVLFNIIWPDYFGRKHLGSIRSIAMMTTVIGSAFGPLPFAAAYDYIFGGYTEILFLLVLLPAAGIAAAVFSPPPQKS